MQDAEDTLAGPTAGTDAEARGLPPGDAEARARVRRRHVFFIAGFDPMAVDGHHRIFVRELKRFGSVWNVRTHCRDAAPVPTPTGGFWRTEADTPNWHTETTFENLGWHDLTRADMGRSVWSHLKGSVRALADMVTSGTIANYFRSSRRYGLFFLFTYMLLALFWGLAAAAGFFVYQWVEPLGRAAALAAAGGTTVAAGLFLMRWPGRRFRLKQSLDLAEFSVEFVRGRHPEVEARVVAFADRLRAVEAEAEAQGVEEIIIAGHSLGAMLAVSAVAGALAADPAFGTRARVRILTLGSTTAKFALHPAGGRFREAAERVAAAEAIGWVEVQSRDDIVSFYKVDPVTLGPASFAPVLLPPGDYSLKPLIRHVEIRQMISPAIYRRHWFDVMRLHCQCFLAGDIRSTHDFYAYVCGPLSFDVLASHTNSLRAYVRPDGTLRPLVFDAAGCILPLPESETPA
ncbi:hypothetical protein [Xanthobacter wiegelii]|uniref:hypothetical protein n=1 Tax=Xanthobacter wiegelii TaxID=3119913 RepID=UPI003727AB39